MSKLINGINEVTNSDYHKDTKYLSSSDLKMLLKDVEGFHDKKILGNYPPEGDNPAFAEGSLVHAMILEPHVIDQEFAFWDGWRKTGPEWRAFCADPANAGKTLMSKPQQKRCEHFYQAYTENPIAHKFCEGGLPEHTVCATIKNVNLKMRADYINFDKGFIMDVKTTGFAADQETFALTVDRFRYDLSAALYCAIAEEHYGKPFDFYFVVISKRDKICEVFKLSDNTMFQGKMMITKALDTYQKCMKSGIWTTEHANRRKIVEEEDYEILEI